MRISSLTPLFLALLVVVHSALCITIKVDPRDEQCFYERVEKQDVKVQVQFQVASGGFLDIDLNIYAPSQNLVHTAARQTEGKYTFVANEQGDYKFCFSNQLSTLTPKTIAFEVHAGDFMDPHLIKIDNNDPIQKSLMRLTDGMTEVLSEQKFYKIREHSHRDLVEETNTKVVIWSIIEIIVLVLISVWQVFYLRNFFSVKKSNF
ncbi:transmembrane emp24 domain-containing protein [Acrasis kona]|uniref:Transmembrane emp24 domain-containing protein n=1 Tax=Acrasis kona TaxID=1008807 RepID=A0AAW2ZS88_9EUKA